jgi:cation transport ATPase
VTAALLFYIAVVVAAITAVVWVAVGQPAFALNRSVTVLVIACPHALGLAIPLVTAISTSKSARSGILVKDRLALEAMRNIDTVLFDKTGTLTLGEHRVTGDADRRRPGARRCCDWQARSRPTRSTRWPARSMPTPKEQVGELPPPAGSSR